MTFRFGRRPPVRLSPVVPPGRRIYAIGDIHGRLDLLSQVFREIDAHKHRYPVADAVEVFLGDYIDRGPASREVIQALIERSAVHRAVHLLGNHEAVLLASVRETETLARADAGRMLQSATQAARPHADRTPPARKAPPPVQDAIATWRRIGALATLRSYGVPLPPQPQHAAWPAFMTAFVQALPPAHRAFYAGLRPTYICGDYLFVHAGIRPGIPVAAQRIDDLIWIREPFLSWPRDHEYVVVHGHTPRADPEFLPNRINIDTGAYATGHLTCLVLQDTMQDILG